jgi:hypothetical protein
MKGIEYQGFRIKIIAFSLKWPKKRTKKIHTPNRARTESVPTRFGLNPCFDVRRNKRYVRKKELKRRNRVYICRTQVFGTTIDSAY